MLVDADGDLDELTAVLVPYIDAVLARVVRSDFVDDKAGELATVKRDLGVLVRGDFLLILEPADLRGRLAPHSAGQAQRLQKVESQLMSKCIQNIGLCTVNKTVKGEVQHIFKNLLVVQV